MRKILTFCLLVLVTFGCTKKEPKKIKIGLNSWPGYEFIYLAKEMKYYEEEGLNVEIVNFESLSDGRRAFEKKQIDILGTNMIELVISRAQSNVSGQILLVGDYSNGADVIIADKKFKKMKDLKGKNIGVELGTLTVYSLSRALELEGMKLDDVKLFPTDQVQADENFKNKSIDAMVTYPPFMFSLKEKYQLKEIFTSKKLPKELIDVVIADKQFIDSNKEEMKKFLRAYFRAVNLTVSGSEDAIRLMAEREKLSISDFKHSIYEDMVIENLNSNRSVYFKDDYLDIMAKKVAKVLIEIKQIDEDVNINDVKSSLINEI